MKITIEKENGDKGTTIEMGKDYKSEMYRPGGMICQVAPWGSDGCTITLHICICPDGEILTRSWEWGGTENSYLHTFDHPEDVEVTPEMQETVSGLFSGRIKVEGIKISVGASVQEICPIDLEAEEARIGKKIYLA